ncbi:MAG: hypothetical protein HQ478_10040 [Chloroflexi bacterium]|nr:hypothetical protein [Chloroflexota bacterium]
MTQASSSIAADRLSDQLWARALSKITRGPAEDAGRATMGDQISTFVPQVATSLLMSSNPAFSRVLYAAGYASSKRNAYFIMRRLGMPSDFFWKFDIWDDERAFTTLKKVMDRIFKSLMKKTAQGDLDLISVDVVNGRFVVEFKGCAECSGVGADRSICFFHAGMFAGVLGAMLDRDLDAWESECGGSGHGACRFVIGNPTDREIAAPLDDQLGSFTIEVDPVGMVGGSLERLRGDDNSGVVDVGYYQLLLASSVLSNLEIGGDACFETGARVGAEIIPLIREQYEGTPEQVIESLYSDLRYMTVDVIPEGDGFTVVIGEAPEIASPLNQAAFVPFIAGELDSLLEGLSGNAVRFASSERDGESLRLVFVPEV